MISLQNITKIYRVGNHKVLALKNVSLKFRESEFVCIHGPSGCGKTTLLNIIGGLDRHTNGRFQVDDQNSDSFRDEDWDAYRNQRIGFVFQDYYLLPQLNVFENIEMALNLVGTPKSERKSKVRNALKTVGLLGEAENYPKQLSGGQMQRVAIARAIVNDPDIVLADEPTGALDSNNAKIIMELLKEISKERLVIVVSHNLELSKQYSNRIIEMLDGEIIDDSKPVQESADLKPYLKKKVSMPFWNAFLLSWKNLLRMKLRTPLTVIAGCIGIIGIGLVLSVSKGVANYIEEAQKSALANYPIYISSYVKPDEDKEPVIRQPFPDTDEISIWADVYEDLHLNAMKPEFLEHIGNLDPSLYTAINYNKTVPLNLIAKNESGYEKVYQSRFYELVENDQFILDQYDVLDGQYPKEINEVALLVDRYNSIDISFLDYLRIDYEGKESFTFDEILSMEFKLISNNDYYRNFNGIYLSRPNSDYEAMYNDAELTIKVVGIMRVREDARSEIFQRGLLYTPKLTDYVVKNALESDIVKDQLEFGMDKNVFTNGPFEDIINPTYILTAEYQYEENLYRLGAYPKTSAISIYTSTFEKRTQIETHIKSYSDEDSYLDLTYTDRMKNIILEFAQLAKVFSTVLIIFSSVSLIVSSILIGILTYVSVNERTKEIGLLRSIGARKKDVSRLFNFETLIIGLFSGILGVIGVLLSMKPVNEFVQSMIEDYTVTFKGISKVIVAQFEFKYALILIVGSMIITLLAGFIPAKIASRKSPIDALRSER